MPNVNVHGQRHQQQRQLDIKAGSEMVASDASDGGPTDFVDDNDGEATPRLFPISGDGHDDLDDDDDVFTFSKRSTNTLVPSDEAEDDDANDRSGAWSGFSWSSLYEEDHEGRDAESSLSWADEEMERETTERVAKMFRQIDDELYQDASSASSSSSSSRTPTPSRIPKMSAALKEECAIWRDKFPHLRIKGRRARLWPPPSPSSSEEAVPNEEEGEEEVFASHSDSPDAGGDHLAEGLEGLTLNERFEEDPVGYFTDKVMSAVFRRVWSDLVTEELSSLTDIYAQRIIQDSMEMQSLSSRESSAAVTNRSRLLSSSSAKRQSSASSGITRNARTASRFQNRRDTIIDAIDENSETSMIGLASTRMVLKAQGEDPVSLPNLAAKHGAKPKVESSNNRPYSSQVSGRGFSARRKRTQSFKGDRSSSRLTNNSPSPEDTSRRLATTRTTFSRMRSHSGSPPRGLRSQFNTASAAAASRKTDHHQKQQPPLSLPPIIQGISASKSSGSLSVLSASTIRAPAANASTVGSSAKVGLLSRRGTSSAAPHHPSMEPRSAVNAISVSGRRLRSIKREESPRAASRMSAGWDSRVSSAATASRWNRRDNNRL